MEQTSPTEAHCMIKLLEAVVSMVEYSHREVIVVGETLMISISEVHLTLGSETMAIHLPTQDMK